MDGRIKSRVALSLGCKVEEVPENLADLAKKLKEKRVKRKKEKEAKKHG